MKIHLVRHGETDWNLTKKIQGSTDTELNETGICQAKQLAEKLLLNNIHPCAVYTSPLKRAHVTADTIAEAYRPRCSHPLPVIAHPGLTELDFGNWEGLTWDQVREQYPEDYNCWRQNRRYEHPTGGESYQELLDRVLPAMQEIVNSQGGVNSETELLIVVHSAIIISLRAWMDDTPFHEMAKRYPMGNAESFVFDAACLYKTC